MEYSASHFWHIVIYCSFLKVSGLGHFKVKGKPLKMTWERIQEVFKMQTFLYT
jgi:hypothetical protein